MSQGRKEVIQLIVTVYAEHCIQAGQPSHDDDLVELVDAGFRVIDDNGEPCDDRIVFVGTENELEAEARELIKRGTESHQAGHDLFLMRCGMSILTALGVEEDEKGEADV